MNNNLITAGYNEYRESLLEKLSEPLDMYIMCKLKIEQLKKNGIHPPTFEAIDNQMMAHKDRIAEILIQEKDVPWASNQTD